ncbi:MAG: C-terminal binding protein [Candidatus Binatia bacterium]|jgi:C-terminal binding protein
MSKEFKVVVTDFLEEPLEHERKILGDLAEVVALNAVGESTIDDRINDADAIMLYHFISMTEPTLRRLTNCKLIVRCGVGVDNVDHKLARELGIPVANVPDYGTEEVADSAIGMALSLMRGIHLLNSRLQRGEGDWTYTQAAPIHRLRGKIFGIVGLGRIGTATALRAKALGMEVAFYDPYVPDGRDKSLGVRRVESLDELLTESHILSLHCPSTPETTGMIDADAIAKMQPGSFLVNTARGVVVEPEAVLDAITNEHLHGAAIDVLPTEPPDDDDPLIAAWRDPDDIVHDRVIINPHSAFYCEDGLVDMRVKGSQNCRRAILGEALRNVVN